MPEVALYMGLHPQTARDWVRKGILPPPAIKVGRTVRWSRAQLEKVVAEGVSA
uniref:helix-turn-helix transcriptional regulator n=1 Tax=Rhodoferax sp. TaxID=50421 RepID=UPI00351D3198